MFSKTLSVFSILSFNKDDYGKVIKNIEASRGYISFIDSMREKGVINTRYRNYLDTKQTLYTVRPPSLPTKNPTIMINNLDEMAQKRIDDLYEKYGVQNDYYVERQLIKEEAPFLKLYSYQAIPIECAIFDDSINLDNQLEKLNRSCLSDKFIMNKHRRFMLLPFILKMNDNYVEPIVIANVYDVGIITIQLILYFEHQKVIELPESPPRYERFPEIQFYKVMDNYKSDDFWEKEVKKNLTADMIVEYYEKQLSRLSKCNLKSNPNNRSVSWVFGDFELNKYSDHQEFIKKHIRLYASHLSNGPKELIERKTNEDIGKLLEESSVTQLSDICYYCTPAASLVSVGYKPFLNVAKSSLKDNEEDLKKAGIYSTHLNQIFRSLTLDAMLQFFRFYELTFIKKYFLKELMNDISLGSYKTINEYNAVKRELNFIKLQYDEEVLFFTEGSPKELYKNILEKTNVNKLQIKVEEMVKSIREDTSILRDADIKKNETIILMLTSFLTILLGYTSIKFIVNDVLANLPLIGSVISKHPLRYIVSIWGTLILVMVWLNFKRWRVNK
jgi:hypothetical protein